MPRSPPGRSMLGMPSMKVPPKRKGNSHIRVLLAHRTSPSMKVPPKRKGNVEAGASKAKVAREPSMKVPPKRKGNGLFRNQFIRRNKPSMKVPPKRKGNVVQRVGEGSEGDPQ